VEHCKILTMCKPSFSRFFIILLIIFPGMILTSCGQFSMGTSVTPTIITSSAFPAGDQPPTQTPFLPAIFTPTFTETGTPVETPTQLVTPTLTLTKTLTETPTETPPSFTYFFPIQPPSLANFGEGVASHGYPATDIFAPEGTKVVAVTDGVVNFVSYQDTWDPQQDDPATRGGLSVAIIGDDGVRYYGSHLSVIQGGITPGVRVAAGQLLGYVGHTGDARNTESHLHFGISRPTFPEDWKARRGQVDPYAYLFAWRSGLNLTPFLPAP